MLKVSLATWLAEKEEKDLQLVTLKAYHYAMAGSIAGTIGIYIYIYIYSWGTNYSNGCVKDKIDDP